MRDLSPGWATSLAILEQTGSTVEDHGDHLVVRTPRNPTFHWGNCLLVRADDRLDDADHWLARFAAELPDAGWVAVALPRLPDDVSGWTAAGTVVEQDEVLATDEQPRLLTAAEGYRFAAVVSDDDWEQQVARSLRDNLATGDHEPAGYERFARAEAALRRELCERGVASWFGAWATDGPDAGTLVADLGIVLCGTGRGPTARYQSVGTDEAHRRQGLAGHLLGLAGAWSAEHGARHWVIVTGVTNPAGRLYRSVGFGPADADVQAYRKPAEG